MSDANRRVLFQTGDRFWFSMVTFDVKRHTFWIQSGVCLQIKTKRHAKKFKSEKYYNQDEHDFGM